MVQKWQRLAALGVGVSVLGALLGGILVGFSPLATGVLVVAAFGGSAFVARGLNLIRGAAALSATTPARYSIQEISTLGRREAATFGELAKRIHDPDLRRRVAHIGERLATVFGEIERRPEAMDDMDAVHSFVLDFLPRAVKIIERYLELTAKFSDVDPAQLRGVTATVNHIADTVKSMYDRLVSHELAEFASANLALQTELELDNPTLRLPSRTEQRQ